MERAWPDAVGAAGPARMQGLRGSALKPPSPQKVGPRSFLRVLAQNFSPSVSSENPRLGRFRQDAAFAGGRPPMFDRKITVLLRGPR
jgi:hypothetical protein